MHASRLVEDSQQIRSTGQIRIKSDEHASGDRPDGALDHPGYIPNGIPKSIRQCRVAANCLVTKADSPGTVMNDVPGREGCAEPLNLEPAGGMCKISCEGLRRYAGIVQGDEPRRAAAMRCRKSGNLKRPSVIVDTSGGQIAVDFHPGDFISCVKTSTEKEDAPVAKTFSEEILVAQPDHPSDQDTLDPRR